jgi:outer membrane protein TolC
MNLMKNTILAFTFLVSSTVLLSQSAGNQALSFSLEEAISHAVEHNLNAENARLDVNAADSRVWETAASGLPQVNASLVYNNNLALATTLIPDFFNDPTQKIAIQFGTKHFATAGVAANQLIFSGQYIVGLQAAKLFKEFTRKNLELTEQQVKEAVTEGYYLVLLSENTLEALSGNLENMKLIYEETVELFKAGFIEEIDADQLEITLTDLENAVSSMERQLLATRSLLKYQMGLNLDQDIVLSDKLEDLVRSVDIQMLMGLEMDVESNITYQILDEQERLAMMDMRLKQTDYMPTINAFLSLDYTAQRDEFNFLDNNEDWYEAAAVGFSLNVPIFSSGMRRAGVAQKRIAYEQAKNTKTFAVEGMRIEFTQAQYDFATAYERFKREEKNLELTQKVIASTETKYSEGLVSSLELTQVNDQFLQTLSSYTSAMVELLNAKVTLDVLLNTI